MLYTCLPLYSNRQAQYMRTSPLPAPINAISHDANRYISLTETELKMHIVVIQNGLLVWKKDNSPVSTENMTGKSALSGFPIAVPDLAAYAIDCEDNIYVHEHISPESHSERKNDF